ncbi:uncharacterized protein LOC128343362 isoform X2 [Hemicordylus capensis]|uniref:uncharacterized protein LOC128343362 isoform X2 n=1 Tax=Hemicordylus capensis TaxID=884348 RepID=UPI0023044521|nr:uncharacterized protein LOC128343362 isoform X2 [Hemicordylus capensis]
MGLLSWWFLLLGAPAFLLGHCSGSSSHSIDFFYTGVSEPSQGLPQFMAVEFVDDQYLAYYDTTTKKALPRAPWTRKLEKDNPQYWDSYTKTTQSWEETFRTSLANLQDSYKHSGGLHTWQKMYGCHLSEDGQKGGYMRYGYDGRDFISFDKDTLTWTAVDAVAEKTKRKWDGMQTRTQDKKRYLEVTCINWLQKYLAYGNETLLRKGSSSHSLRFFYTGVSEASRGLPEFMALELVDDQPTCYYDSSINRPLPHAQWMEKVENDNAQYWDSKSKSMENWEANFRRSLVNMRNDYNQSWGLHTWQHMSGCHLSEGGQKGGYMRYGYDGRDFISFDKDTLTWTAVDAVAEKTKRKWDGMQTMTQDHKRFLEVTCINWLQKYLAYGNETFLRKEIPVVRMARKAASDGREALICQAFGFYPKEIDITWRMDNVIWEHKTLRGDVIPNSDGTYYTWINTEIDAEHKDPYKCHVEHSSLPEPLDLSLWEEFDVTRSWQDISWITHTISPPATTWAPATTSPPATTWAPVTTSPTATTSPPGTTWAPATTSPPATTWAPVTTSPTATTSPPGTTWAPATTSPPATTWAPVTTSSTATTSPPGTTWAPATTSTPATTWAPATTSVPVTTHQMQSITLPLSIKSLLHQSVHPCRKDEAVCPNQQCIPRKLLCNGDRDCSDGSDELNCDPASKAVCLQGSIMATRTVILLGVGIYLIFVHIHK